MTQQEQVEMNYKAFQEMLSSIIVKHRNKHALMKDGKIIEYFDTSRNAFIAGELLYGNFYEQGRYSVQKVTDEVINLGFWAYII